MASLIDPRWWRTAAANPRNWPFDGDKCRRRLHRRHHFSAGSSPVHFVVPRCPPGLSPTWSFLRCSKLHLPSATIASSLSTPLMVVVFGIFVTTSVDTDRCRLLFGNVILVRFLPDTPPLHWSDAIYKPSHQFLQVVTLFWLSCCSLCSFTGLGCVYSACSSLCSLRGKTLLALFALAFIKLTSPLFLSQLVDSGIRFFSGGWLPAVGFDLLLVLDVTICGTSNRPEDLA